jgi:hypothetical protein
LPICSTASFRLLIIPEQYAFGSEVGAGSLAEFLPALPEITLKISATKTRIPRKEKHPILFALEVLRSAFLSKTFIVMSDPAGAVIFLPEVEISEPLRFTPQLGQNDAPSWIVALHLEHFIITPSNNLPR